MFNEMPYVHVVIFNIIILIMIQFGALGFRKQSFYKVFAGLGLKNVSFYKVFGGLGFNTPTAKRGRRIKFLIVLRVSPWRLPSATQ